MFILKICFVNIFLKIFLFVILFFLEFIKICDVYCFIGDNNINKICDVNVNLIIVISLYEKKSKIGYDFLIICIIIK